MEYKDPVGAHRNAGIPVTERHWKDEHIIGEDVGGVVFQNCVFENVVLEDMIFKETVFVGCRFDDCVFENCHLNATTWVECNGSGLRIAKGVLYSVAFSQANMTNLTIEQNGAEVVITESKFGVIAFNGDGCKQYAITLSGCDVGELKAENLNWENASVVGLDASKWLITNAVFDSCNLVQTKGEKVDFSTVNFKSCNLYQGKFAHARFRLAEGSIFAECDLTEADFSTANIKGAMFAKSDASGARFDQAEMEGALFPKAKLVGASMVATSAAQSIWTEADLTSADMSNMNAYQGIFRNAVLKDAVVINANFAKTDLHGVKEPLEGADLSGSRGSIQWRAEIEEQAKAGSK